MRNPPKLLVWLAPLGLLACTMALQGKNEGGSDAPPAPKISVNHKAHLGQDLLCIDCHDPEETGNPRIPAVETCFDCHEADLSGENERVQAYFDAIRQADGGYVFPKLDYSEDLAFQHKPHLDQEMECADCHGEASEKAFTRPPALQLKANCYECHEEESYGDGCAKCHKETRRDRKPAGHTAAFRKRHGKELPEDYTDRLQASCWLCHEVPQGCNECHAEAKPASHDEAGFRLEHGKGYTEVADLPFEESSCAMCHEEQSCVRCHQSTKPASHTSVWVRRLHGIQADMERQSCRVCHQQDFCLACHQTTQPITHRGSFLSGPQAHCLNCHEPLQSTGCFVCHKDTLGHLSATALPPGPPHSTASSPSDCEACHALLPHFNDGGDCRRCHN